MGEPSVMEVREDSGDSFIKSLEAPEVDGEGEVQVEELDVDEDGRIVKEQSGEGEVKKVEGEVKTEEKEGEEVKEETKTPAETPEEDPRDKELSELRALAREQRKEMAVLKESVTRMNKVQQGEVGDDTHTTPGELEQLHQDIQTLQADRKNFLEETKALMEINPKFEDIDSVITSRRVSDIVELAAKNLAPKYSKDEVSMGLIIEKNIWGMPNPYKYLYELIKENHPDFSKKEVAEESKTEGTKEVTSEEVKRSTSKVTTEKKPVETPTAISAISSGTQNNGGWTSSRIDDMPESELHKVPRDVYAAYLAGDLP